MVENEYSVIGSSRERGNANRVMVRDKEDTIIVSGMRLETFNHQENEA
jgi:hypothetical protein